MYRETWRLAAPLILSNLSVPLLGMVDTAVVGHLPEPHDLGAVALGAQTFNVLFFVFGFLRMGTTGLAAQAFGRAASDELRAVLARSLIVAAALAALLLLVGGAVERLAVALYAPGPEIAASLHDYVAFRLFSAPAVLAKMVVLGWLLGLQDARSPLVLLLVTNATNAALDVVLVVGFGLGAGGVGAATTIAEYVGLAVGLVLLRRALRAHPGRWSWAETWTGAAFKRLLAVNRDIFLRSCALEAVTLAFFALSARQGEVTLAANAVLFTFVAFAAYGLDGFAFAAEALVGRTIGERSRARFAAATRAAASCSALLALIIATAYAFGGTLLVQALTGIAAVQEEALRFLAYVPVLPLIAVWAYLLDGIFIGATRTVPMRNGMAVASVVFLGSAWLLMPPLGNHGLWLAYACFLAARGLWLGAVYRRIEAGPGFVAS